MNRYRAHRRRRILFLIVCAVALAAAALVALAIGSVKIPAGELLAVLIGRGAEYPTSAVIIWNIRLPRILTALVAGMGLAVAGAAMQGILRNPIGSPFTLGVSHAAAFGAALAIVGLGAGSHQSAFSDAVTISSPYLITTLAFACAMISTGVIIFLAKIKGATPETLILAGVALGSLFVAGTTALEYFADEVQLASIIFWTFGDVSRASWGELGVIAAVTLPSLGYFIASAWNYNAMDAGEDTARSLGVNVERVRIVGLVVATLVTAIAVAFVGIIGFLGLVVPHIVRKLLGGDQRFLMIGSALVGGLLLILSDLAARLVLAPRVLPVGILTAFFGAPVFLVLVIKGRRYW